MSTTPESLIGKNPVPSHLGVNSRRLRHHRPSSTHNCECSRAPKNRLAQNFDCGKMLKIQRARRDNVQFSKCSSRATEASTVHTSHRVHADMPANVGITARGAEIPVKPAKSMPLPLSTTSAAHFGMRARREATRIDLRIQSLPLHVEKCTNSSKSLPG